MINKLIVSVLVLASFPSFAQDSDLLLKALTTDKNGNGFRRFVASEYMVPEKNIAQLAELKSKTSPLKISEFGSAKLDLNTLWCRASYPIHAPGKISYANFIGSAMKLELEKAGLYSETNGRNIKIFLDFIDFDSTGDAKWMITGTFSLAGKPSVTIKKEFPFDTPMFGKICEKVSPALVPAVQSFLSSAYADPKFQELIQD